MSRLTCRLKKKWPANAQTNQQTDQQPHPVFAPPCFERIHSSLTPELRHRHRSLTLAAMMISEFHGPVKTEGAVAVACSDFVRCCRHDLILPTDVNQRMVATSEIQATMRSDRCRKQR